MQEFKYIEPGSGKANHRERTAFWQRAIKDQENSGLSVAKFCKQNNIARRKLHDWKYKFKKAGLLDKATREETVLSKAELIPITIQGCESEKAAKVKEDLLTMEINVPGGTYKCSFHFSERLLESIVSVFKRIC